jgi:Spy/CpxP family protein refolding chaperone
MNFKVSTRTLLIAGVLTLGGAATAFAVAPTDGERCGPGRGMHGMSHGMQHGMPGMARLHGDLKLDAKQEALWQEAEKSAKENTSGMREQMRKQREAALETLKQPGADLRAVMKQMDDARDAGRKQHEASRDRWLAAYDSLNAEQKEKARLFFKDKLERMERFGKGGRDRG